VDSVLFEKGLHQILAVQGKAGPATASTCP